MRTQLLIVGAGPAGCMAAIAALNRDPGLDVVLLDKSPGPRHRIGEILLTQTIMEMERHGLGAELADAARRHGWGRKFALAYVHGKDRTPWIIRNNHPFAKDEERNYPQGFSAEDGRWFTLMVPRHEFDQELRQMAVARGAKIMGGEARELRLAGEGADSHVLSVGVFTNEGEEITIRPLQLIDASGQYAFVSRQMKTRRKLNLRPLAARYTYFRNVDYAKAMTHGFYEEGANILSYGMGWVWIANLGKGISSVGVVSDEWEGGFFKRLTEMPEAPLFGLDKAVVVDHLGEPAKPDHHYVHPDYSYESAVPFGRNWISVGDAARFLDPLLSQGVTLAVTFGGFAGKTAADIIAGRAEDAASAYASLHKGYEAEVAILKHVVGLWYKPEEQRCPKEWMAAASRIERIFGRPIKDDITSFRWVANLENVHLLMEGGHEADIIRHLDDAAGETASEAR
jgi:FADH2 O2-dependent halogenase